MVTDSEYALMAGRTYQSTRDPSGINWFPAPSGWTEFFHTPADNNLPTNSGFEATSFFRPSPPTGGEIVIAFAGTASGVDWYANAGGFFGLPTGQLRQAVDYYLAVIKGTIWIVLGNPRCDGPMRLRPCDKR